MYFHLFIIIIFIFSLYIIFSNIKEFVNKNRSNINFKKIKPFIGNNYNMVFLIPFILIISSSRFSIKFKECCFLFSILFLISILLKITNKNRYKKSTSFILLFIFVWYSCGGIYWISASITKGSSFQFQEDLLISYKVKEFKSKVSIDVDDNYIKGLFKSFDKYAAEVKMNAEAGYIHFNFNGIGYEWASYYQKKLAKQSVNFFTINKKDEVHFGSEKYYNIEMFLYNLPNQDKDMNDHGTMTYKSEYKDKMKKIDVIYVAVKESTYNNLRANLDSMTWSTESDNDYYPLYLGKDFIASSIHYVDNDYYRVNEIEKNNNFSYPFWDFLYFSAVTITTLGYGDILPNTTLIRSVIMVESLLGVILLSMFVSQKFVENSVQNAKSEPKNNAKD